MGMKVGHGMTIMSSCTIVSCNPPFNQTEVGHFFHPYFELCNFLLCICCIDEYKNREITCILRGVDAHTDLFVSLLPITDNRD